MNNINKIAIYGVNRAKEDILEQNSIFFKTEITEPIEKAKYINGKQGTFVFDLVSKLEKDLQQLKEIISDDNAQLLDNNNLFEEISLSNDLNASQGLALYAWQAIKTVLLPEIKHIEKHKTSDSIYLKHLIETAYDVGATVGELTFWQHEKDLVQKLRMEAGKNKNNPEYWANRLEEEYCSQPPKKSEKGKKSDCYYIIADEFKKINQKEPPSHKALRDWWKKYFPERWK